jgi:O-antigen/teichoic acid export membrane protein
VTRAPEAQSALRNAGFLVIQRGGLLAAGVMFAVLVPRLMGPAAYGRFALVSSLSTLFVMCSTLGFTEVAGRFLPELSRRPDSRDLHRLVNGLLSIRLVAGALLAAAFLGVTTVWLPDLDAWALVAVSAAILVRAVSHLLFALFLGLNQAARWGAGELLSRSLLLVFVLPGDVRGGFRGACVGLLLAEVATLAIALGWTRSMLSLARLRIDPRTIGPYLRVGLVYFAVNLLLIAFQASGESLVRLVTHDYASVSYFGIANSIHLSAVAAIQQLSLAFAALLITLRAQRADAALREGLRRLVSWTAAAGVSAVFAVLLLGPDLIPLVLGRSFEPVVSTLIPMTLALLPLALSSVASVVAVTHDRPGALLLGAGLRLAVFWGAGPFLVVRAGSLGACLAVLLAHLVQAGYLSWVMRAQMAPAVRSWAACVLAGAPLLPLVWLRSSIPVETALFVGGLAGFFGLLLLTRVLAVSQIVETWRSLGQAGRTRRTDTLQDLGGAAGSPRR